MKREGILQPALAAAIAGLGHGHLVVIADCGLPIPADVVRVDLALVAGVPRFTEVLDALLAELVVEGSLAAVEAGAQVTGWFTERGLDPEKVPHGALKAMVSGARLVVRTGEATPYANIILRCGVPF